MYHFSGQAKGTQGGTIAEYPGWKLYAQPGTAEGNPQTRWRNCESWESQRLVDRVIQQAIAQKLQGIWEPLFSDSSYGYRPKRSAQQTIRQVKENAEQGYRYAVSVDLLKYFDTLNHELLMNLLHRQILYIGLTLLFVDVVQNRPPAL